MNGTVSDSTEPVPAIAHSLVVAIQDGARRAISADPQEVCPCT